MHQVEKKKKEKEEGKQIFSSQSTIIIHRAIKTVLFSLPLSSIVTHDEYMTITEALSILTGQKGEQEMDRLL